jgi:hypothetical protein
VEPVDPLRDRAEVGQQAAQPTLVHVRHPRSLRPLADRVTGLLLGADGEQRSALAGYVGAEPSRLVEQPLGLEQIDDVDPVALTVDVAAHPRVPAARLVAKVDPGLEQLLDSYLCHEAPLSSLFACQRLGDPA